MKKVIKRLEEILGKKRLMVILNNYKINKKETNPIVLIAIQSNNTKLKFSLQYNGRLLLGKYSNPEKRVSAGFAFDFRRYNSFVINNPIFHGDKKDIKISKEHNAYKFLQSQIEKGLKHYTALPDVKLKVKAIDYTLQNYTAIRQAYEDCKAVSDKQFKDMETNMLYKENASDNVQLDETLADISIALRQALKETDIDKQKSILYKTIWETFKDLKASISETKKELSKDLDIEETNAEIAATKEQVPRTNIKYKQLTEKSKNMILRDFNNFNFEYERVELGKRIRGRNYLTFHKGFAVVEDSKGNIIVGRNSEKPVFFSIDDRTNSKDESFLNLDPKATELYFSRNLFQKNISVLSKLNVVILSNDIKFWGSTRNKFDVIQM